MINVFIGLSNNQISNYELLLPNVKDEINVLITENKTYKNSVGFSRIILAEGTLKNQANGFLNSLKNIINKIKVYKKIINELKEYENTKDIRLYFTYVEDILTNYLLFSFNRNLIGIAVEDGVLNYYNHDINFLSSRKIFLKKTLSNLYGIPFIKYKGHSSGIEYDHVLEQYVREPKLSVFPNKSKKLPYLKRNVKLTNSILIIGQEPYINLFGYDTFIKQQKLLFEFIITSSEYKLVSKIYYKPHRNGKRIQDDPIFKTFFDKKLVFLSAEDPLEELYFNKLGSKFIYSFDSSALISIFLESDVSIQDKIQFKVLPKFTKQLKYVFNKFKFIILE